MEIKELHGSEYWERDLWKLALDVDVSLFLTVNYLQTAYPAVYGQFPQAIPQPMAAVASQREGKNH